MKLVMGSCRLAEPMRDVEDVILYPGGHVHSTAEFVQAIRIMQGDLIPPMDINAHLFRGWGVADQKLVDLGQVDTVVLELCSLKNYMFGEWILHVGYAENVETGELSPLDGVQLRKESYREVLENLDRIQCLLRGRQMVVVLQNNIPALPERYLLGHAASEWCRDNSQRLVDATSIVAEYGVERCLPVRDGEWDFTHYSDFMKAKVRDVFSEDAASQSYAVRVPGPVLAAIARDQAEEERARRRRARLHSLNARVRGAVRCIPGALWLVRFFRANAQPSAHVDS